MTENLPLFVEAILAAVLLGLAALAQFALAGAFYLFRRRFWVDEIVVHTLVSDPDWSRAFRALAGGLDTNPPAYHLLLRGWRALARSAGEAALRCLSFLAVLAGLGALYFLLRQVFSPLPAFAAVLAVWGHPMVLRYAFEARMYGPWLAATVWFTCALSLAWNQPADLGLQVLLAVTAVLTCTLHTLGTVALIVALGAHLLAHGSAPWPWSVLVVAELGPLAFLAWCPVLCKQNAAYPVTWVPPLTIPNIAYFLQSTFLPRHLAVVLLGAGLAPFLFDLGGQALPTGPPGLTTLAGLAGLAFVPGAFLLLSYAVQPLLVERYALPAVASFAPAVAFVTLPLPDLWLVVLCGLLFLCGIKDLADLCDSFRHQEARQNGLITALRNHLGPKDFVLFEDPDDLFVVCRYGPDLAQRCFAPDFGPQGDAPLSDYRLGASTQARIFARFYPQLALMAWNEACRFEAFYFVPHAGEKGPEVATRYPQFEVVPVEAGLYVLCRRDSGMSHG